MLFMKIIIIFIIMLFLNINPSLASYTYQGPEDKRAVEESEKAVKRLGQNRGAIQIVRKVVDIIGLKSTSFSGSSVGISKALIDLGAKKVGTEIRISLSGDILFDFDKWEIKKEAETTLQKLAEGIKESNKKNIIIEGHTDSKGSDSYNLKLSRNRAKAVRDWFISKASLINIQFRTNGYGESRPIAPNTNPDGSDNVEGRAKNRRVEVRILD
jgi:outer membrane protein OmpA-like peptidoglycan-associated protein